MQKSRNRLPPGEHKAHPAPDWTLSGPLRRRHFITLAEEVRAGEQSLVPRPLNLGDDEEDDPEEYNGEWIKYRPHPYTGSRKRSPLPCLAPRGEVV